MKTFLIHNLGCKVNHYEAQAVAGMLEQRGWQRAEAGQSCSAVIIFTCAVTNTAAQKSRQMMHRLKRLYPDAALVMVGCYVQVAPDALSDADILVGSAAKDQIPDLLEQWLSSHEKETAVADAEQIHTFTDLPLDVFEDTTRAFLKVQDGCNQFCTYCIIPYARGRQRSLDPDIAVDRARQLSVHHHELVLAGIHTGRYGQEYGVSLADLIERLLNETSFQRIRISSIEISEIDDHLISLLSSPRVARHLHIPLQSGSDGVLARMGRPYTAEDYHAKISLLHQEVPDLAISTDLMVGFPEESEQEFQESRDFVKRCGFSFLHVFPYSLRQGTRAASMKQVAEAVKKERAETMLALSEEMYDAYKRSWIGRDADVLMEKDHGSYTPGHASQYFEVRVPGRIARGSMHRVKVQRFEDHVLFGEIDDEAE